jgi:hypothetical protein
MYYYCYTILRYWKELCKNHNTTSVNSEHLPTLTVDATYAQHFQNNVIFQRAVLGGRPAVFVLWLDSILLMPLKVFWACGKMGPTVEILSGWFDLLLGCVQSLIKPLHTVHVLMKGYFSMSGSAWRLPWLQMVWPCVLKWTGQITCLLDGGATLHETEDSLDWLPAYHVTQRAIWSSVDADTQKR